MNEDGMKRGKLEPVASESQSLAGNTDASDGVDMTVNADANLFPYSVVWGPLPLITWLLPFIGHMGICDSKGRVHDFAGPYYIGVNDFMTGAVCKYYQFDAKALRARPGFTGDVASFWDNAVADGDADYKGMMHNLCCNNCHHHTAQCLRYMGFDYTMLKVWWLIQTRGRYTGVGGFLRTYLPFLIMVSIIALAVML